MVFGKDVRLSRITSQGKMVCIPMDHGVSNGPIRGLDTIEETITQLVQGGATAILVHKGIIRSMLSTPKTGLIMHASGSTTLGGAPNRKMLVAGVEEAIRLGADAISLQVNVGSKEEPEMLQDLGLVADECDQWNFPLVAMMYPRGENIRNPNDPETVAHVARIGSELGADIVKTVYTGDYESFRTVVRSCRCPVVIAGGPKSETDLDVLEMAYGAVKAGAIGVTFGRNVFQHERPEQMVRAIVKVVMDGSTPEGALEVVRAGRTG